MRSQIAESRFTGPGEILLAPEVWGDIVPIQLDGQTQWHFAKHAWLASTRDITLNTKAQSIGKALCAFFPLSNLLTLMWALQSPDAACSLQLPPALASSSCKRWARSSCARSRLASSGSVSCRTLSYA